MTIWYVTFLLSMERKCILFGWSSKPEIPLTKIQKRLTSRKE